jgi:hypothetical protein
LAYKVAKIRKDWKRGKRAAPGSMKRNAPLLKNIAERRRLEEKRRCGWRGREIGDQLSVNSE